MPFWRFCFLLCLLHTLQSSNSADSVYLQVPQNATQDSGSSVSFTCAIAFDQKNTTLSFRIINQAQQINGTFTCPGSSSTTVAVRFVGTCSQNTGQLTATWTIPVLLLTDNGTTVLCEGTGLQEVMAQVIVNDEHHYAMLLVYVISGFFSALIVFTLTFLLLKRSTRFQKCLKGKPGDGGISAITM